MQAQKQITYGDVVAWKRKKEAKKMSIPNAAISINAISNLLWLLPQFGQSPLYTCMPKQTHTTEYGQNKKLRICTHTQQSESEPVFSRKQNDFRFHSVFKSKTGI